MKAIVYHRYGSPDVLRCEEIDKPTTDENDVLIKVCAASINPYDWHFMRGKPYLIRLRTGVHKPMMSRLGVDMAGVVEAVGTNVAQFKPGDEVFGACTGAFGEYVRGSEPALAMKPRSVTFEQAACVPIAGVTALQALRKGRIHAGQTVLINGAAGGVGTFAVQIAKSFGAAVTGVCSTRNVDMVRSIGADQVIDYTREDFTKCGRHYDLIFDCIGNHSLLANRRVLNPKGMYIMVGGATGRWKMGIWRLIGALVLSRFVSQKLVGFLAKLNKDDLVTIGELLASGELTPVIDKCYELRELPDAMRYLEEGHARGKVVVSMMVVAHSPATRRA